MIKGINFFSTVAKLLGVVNCYSLSKFMIYDTTCISNQGKLRYKYCFDTLATFRGCLSNQRWMKPHSSSNVTTIQNTFHRNLIIAVMMTNSRGKGSVGQCLRKRQMLNFSNSEAGREWQSVNMGKLWYLYIWPCKKGVVNYPGITHLPIAAGLYNHLHPSVQGVVQQKKLHLG